MAGLPCAQLCQKELKTERSDSLVRFRTASLSLESVDDETVHLVLDCSRTAFVQNITKFDVEDIVKVISQMKGI